jgi:hypothetical protein
LAVAAGLYVPNANALAGAVGCVSRFHNLSFCESNSGYWWSMSRFRLRSPDSTPEFRSIPHAIDNDFHLRPSLLPRADAHSSGEGGLCRPPDHGFAALGRSHCANDKDRVFRPGKRYGRSFLQFSALAPAVAIPSPRAIADVWEPPGVFTRRLPPTTGTNASA